MTSWLRNEPLAANRQCALYIYQDDGVTPAPVVTDFTGFIYFRAGNVLHAAAAGTLQVQEKPDTTPIPGKYVYTATQAETNTTSNEVEVIVNKTGFAYSSTLITITTNPVADTINGILNAMLSDYAVVGSVADGLAVAAGLLQGNFYMDQVSNTSNGQTAARIRIFRTSIAAAAATPNGSGEGEFATYLTTTSYSGPNAVTTHRVVRQ